MTKFRYYSPLTDKPDGMAKQIAELAEQAMLETFSIMLKVIEQRSRLFYEYADKKVKEQYDGVRTMTTWLVAFRERKFLTRSEGEYIEMSLVSETVESEMDDCFEPTELGIERFKNITKVQTGLIRLR
jgi:hypothetical protein